MMMAAADEIIVKALLCRYRNTLFGVSRAAYCKRDAASGWLRGIGWTQLWAILTRVIYRGCLIGPLVAVS